MPDAPEEMPAGALEEMMMGASLPDDGLDSGWLEPEPQIDEAEIKNSLTADVVVVGAGVAGVCAARSAAEAGASVIVLEKTAGISARSGQFAVIGGRINEYFGRPSVDPDEVTNRIMQECSYRIKRTIISRWAHNAHKVFDWFIDVVPELYIARCSDEVIPEDKRRFHMKPLSWPLPEKYDFTKEEFPVYPNSLIFIPGHKPVLKATMKKCTEELGVQALYGFSASKLEQKNGRVCAVLAKDCQDGRYIRVTAKKGIVLATGDNSGNPAIMTHFTPGVLRKKTPVMSMKAKDTAGRFVVQNTGDGLKLGSWLGAAVQQNHAVMSHNMGRPGFLGLGNTPFLFLNKHGQRFMNENVPGQQLQNQIELQPGRFIYQIFDDNWREQLAYMPPNHGCVSSYDRDRPLNMMDETMSEAKFRVAIEKGAVIAADTLEELLEKLDIDKEAALRSIARYNELARNGFDADFNKAASRLFPIEKPPFYASGFGLSAMLVDIGGLESDEECRVYTNEGDILQGLFVAGNVQGNCYAVEYPICIPGLSHSLCMFYGYVAGRNAAAGK
ncbi:MAG: FAD-dependent oxidoreductase [Oscillospiraceae bacterium]